MTFGVNGAPQSAPTVYPARPAPTLSFVDAPAAPVTGAADSFTRTTSFARPAPMAAPAPQSGVFNRLRTIFGLPPAAPQPPVVNPGVFDRLRAIFGLGPPVQPAITDPGPDADLGVVGRLRAFFHLGRDTVTGSFPGNPNAPVSGNISELTPAQLRALGQQSDKTAFFQALLPAAIAAEREYGVPASVTLAQAALESGWARSPIGGYNIFGIKGRGPAGSTQVATHEYVRGVRVPWVDRFALYHNFEEAIVAHGRVFRGNYANYRRGLQEFAQNRDPYRFIANVGPTYATGPNYARSIQSMMRRYGLVDMARAQGGN